MASNRTLLLPILLLPTLVSAFTASLYAPANVQKKSMSLSRSSFYSSSARAVLPRRNAAVVMRSWTAEDMSRPRLEIPSEVESLLSSDTDRRTTEILWAAFRSCFGSDEEAIEAASRNTGTILPYLNSPGNIYGSFEVLVDLLGSDEAATDVCYKNPGVLQCNPTALARESAESILKAADQVDFFEGLLGNLPPALRQNLDKVAFFVLALPIAKRLADCSGATCG